MTSRARRSCPDRHRRRASSSATATSADSACSVVGNPQLQQPRAAAAALARELPVTWLYEGHAASFIGHYIGGVEDDNDSGHAGDFMGNIDAWFTMDLQYGYTIKDWIGKELTLRVGVTNLRIRIRPWSPPKRGLRPDAARSSWTPGLRQADLGVLRA